MSLLNGAAPAASARSAQSRFWDFPFASSVTSVSSESVADPSRPDMVSHALDSLMRATCSASP
jgi:hypothetical protein